MNSNVKTSNGFNGNMLVKKPPHSMAWQLSRGLLVVIVCALFTGGGIYAWKMSFPAYTTNTLLTAVVTRGDIEDTVTSTGTLQPKNYVDVGTQVSGQIKKVMVDVGNIVMAGQLLAEIDPSVYQSKVDADSAQLLNQRAQIADKQAQLVLAELQLSRQKNMARDNATTKEALQIAEATVQSAHAQVNAYKAQMQQTQSTLRGDQANLGYTKIYAPITGTVVSQAAKQGQTLNANQQAPIILRIADLWTMTVQAQVSEADVSKLHVDMEVYFTTLGGNGRRYYGKLRQIQPTPTVVNNVVLYDALFDVANLGQALMTQMTAQVFFVSSSARNAVLVPLTALRQATTNSKSRKNSGIDPRSLFSNGRAIVSVISNNGNASDREVKVGVMNRVVAQITSGLEPGEKVVVGAKLAAEPERAIASGSLATNRVASGYHP